MLRLVAGIGVVAWLMFWTLVLIAAWAASPSAVVIGAAIMSGWELYRWGRSRP